MQGTGSVEKFSVVAFYYSVFIGSNLLLILLLSRFNPNQIFIILLGVNPFFMPCMLS